MEESSPHETEEEVREKLLQENQDSGTRIVQPITDLDPPQHKNVREENGKMLKKKNWRIRNFRPTVEPANLLITIGLIVQSIVVPNMYIDKVCHINFNLSAEMCSNENQTLEDAEGGLLVDRVQSYVSTLNIYGSLINTIPSIFFVLFLGPWSDVHGRKPLMIVPLVGNILSTCILALTYYVGSSLTAEYLLFAELPASFLGGPSTLNLAFLSYLADITSESTRTSRISFLAGTYVLSRPIGSLASRYILQYGGHTAIWCTTLSCYVCAMLWIIFFIQDSRGKGSKLGDKTIMATQPEGRIEGEGILAILKNLKHCFVVTFKPRTGFKRACLAIILTMRCISIFSDDPFGMNYLYSRKKFGWDAPDFALFRVALYSSMAFGSFVVMPLLSNYFKISDTVIGIISLLGDISTCLIIVFATTSLMFFMSSLSVILGMGIVTVMNALPSKLVQSDELGHVYAVSACAEAILPLIGSPTINLIYANTVDFFPGVVYLFGASLDVVLITLFVIVIILQRKEQRLVPIIEDPATANEMPS